MKLIKKNVQVKFMLTLFILGIILGILLYIIFGYNGTNYIEMINDNIGVIRTNIMLTSLLEISTVFILSLLVIGMFIVPFITFYEGVSIGFTMWAFISIYGIKGLLFYILLFIIVKLVYMIILLYFSSTSLNYSYKFIRLFYFKDKEKLTSNIVKYVFRFIIVLLIALFNSSIIYFASYRLVKLIMFLL